MRTYIYIDAFNLYYGALKGKPYKWLDLKALFEKVLQPKNQIICIKYFTAMVSPRPNDPEKPNRQDTYLKALEAYVPGIEIFYGTYLTHTVNAPLANHGPNPPIVQVLKTEEKGSDVNMAVHLLNDSWLDRYDCGVVVSNDSDLAEAMHLVKKQHSKILGVVFPDEKRRGSKELMQYADFTRKIRRNALKNSQLPERIPGTNIHKPPDW
ncbi:MAG: NYN domain-containing protein [Desulfohalobiaceae bacterium]|nr:NYN domain-containing protein [Desulfohalobiaceae bacterium]